VEAASHLVPLIAPTVASGVAACQPSGFSCFARLTWRGGAFQDTFQSCITTMVLIVTMGESDLPPKFPKAKPEFLPVHVLSSAGDRASARDRTIRGFVLFIAKQQLAPTSTEQKQNECSFARWLAESNRRLPDFLFPQRHNGSSPLTRIYKCRLSPYSRCGAVSCCRWRWLTIPVGSGQLVSPYSNKPATDSFITTVTPQNATQNMGIWISGAGTDSKGHAITSLSTFSQRPVGNRNGEVRMLTPDYLE
jgi:hypothetical protein